MTEFMQSGVLEVSNTQNAALVDRLFLVIRTIGTHGPEHPVTVENAEALIETLRQSGLPLALQFVREATFRDKQLVALNLEGFHRSQFLSKALHNCGVHELSFDVVPSVPQVVELAQAVSRGQNAVTDALEHIKIPGMHWREIPGAGWGVEARDIDPDVFAVTQIALAIMDAETIASFPLDAWSWSRGVAIVRRVERALEVDASAAMRAVEFAPAPWTVGRRAVAATLYDVAVLRELGVLNPTIRAAAHASLALGCAGLAGQVPMGISEAAGIALTRMLMSPLESAGGAARHRVRVCAMMHGLHKRTAFRGRWMGILALIDLTYEFECRRQPPHLRLGLSMLDLLAAAVSDEAERFPAAWLRALIAAVGELPAGARVRLADGRIGIVLGPGNTGQAWQPQVLVRGQPVFPDRPVTLVATPPSGRTRV